MLFALKINCHFSLPKSDPWHLTLGQKGQRSAILDLALKIATRPSTWIFFSLFCIKETLHTIFYGECLKKTSTTRSSETAGKRPSSPHKLKFLCAHACLDSHQNTMVSSLALVFITMRMGARPRKCVVGFQSSRPNRVITAKCKLLHLGNPQGLKTINVNSITVKRWKQIREHHSPIEKQGQIFKVIHQEVASLAPNKV